MSHSNFRSFHQSGWLWLLLLVGFWSPRSLSAAGSTALRVDKGTSVLSSWKPEQHVYVKGKVDAAPQSLDALEDWLNPNAPNWTVVLCESALGETWQDENGATRSDVDAVEFALG